MPSWSSINQTHSGLNLLSFLGKCQVWCYHKKKKKEDKKKTEGSKRGPQPSLELPSFFSLGIRIHKIIHHLLDEVFRALLYKLMYLLSAFWEVTFPRHSMLVSFAECINVRYFGVVLYYVDWLVDCTGKQHTYRERGKLELALHLLTNVTPNSKKYIL